MHAAGAASQQPTRPISGSALTILISSDNQTLTVSFVGEIDLSVIGEVSSAIDAAGAAAVDIAIDVHAVTFIDIAGLRQLLRSCAELAERGRRPMISFPKSGPVHRVLELTTATSTHARRQPPPVGNPQLAGAADSPHRIGP